MFSQSPQGETPPKLQPSEVEKAQYLPVHAQDSGFSRWRLDPDDIVQRVEHSLRGEIYKDNEWQRLGKPLANEEGIAGLLTIVGTSVNKVISLTKFQDDEIENIMEHIDDTLIDLLATKYDEWEIDPDFLSYIRELIINFIHASYKQAVGGWTSEQLSQVMTTTERIGLAEAPSAKRRGVFGILGR